MLPLFLIDFPWKSDLYNLEQLEKVNKELLLLKISMELFYIPQQRKAQMNIFNLLKKERGRLTLKFIVLSVMILLNSDMGITLFNELWYCALPFTFVFTFLSQYVW